MAIAAEIKLGEAEIIEACHAYLLANGWKPRNKGTINIIPGSHDARDGFSERTRAEFVVPVDK